MYIQPGAGLEQGGYVVSAPGSSPSLPPCKYGSYKVWGVVLMRKPGLKTGREAPDETWALDASSGTSGRRAGTPENRAGTPGRFVSAPERDAGGRKAALEKLFPSKLKL